ncbi:MAG: F0F1 ATP synthase subunit A [Thermoguttaceae bacterium]|nr:F0F1 ATP synthase subunit A [Thermoguttaceae bacterium]
MSSELIDLNELGSHVSDSASYHLPYFMQQLPDLPAIPLGGGYQLQLTKYMVTEVAVGMLLILIFVPMAMKLRGGKYPKGRFWNFWEVILLYLRNEVIRPSIGKKDAGRFTPFLWTLFFFILFCNLAGLVPWFGVSPTGSLSVTAVMALSTFLVVIGSGMKKFGVVGYWLGQVPKMELPFVLAVLLKPMMFVIEVIGLGIKHVVLAVRLLANMFAGHLVLAVFLAFIAAVADNFVLWLGVTAGSLFMSVCLNCLELFVAFLQAYIFTFLSALFIGMAQHQH